MRAELEAQKTLLLEMKDKTPFTDWKVHTKLKDAINKITLQLITMKD